MKKYVYPILLFLAVILSQTVMSQDYDNSVNTFVKELKRKKLLSISSSDTLSVLYRDSFNNIFKYYLVDSTLTLTKEMTVCDSTRRLNHCLKIYISSVDSTYVSYDLKNWSTYIGYFIVEIKEGEYIIKKTTYVESID